MRNPKYNSAVTVTVYPSPYHGVNYEITPINSLDFSQSASLEVVALLNPTVIYVAPHATTRIKPSPMCPSHRTLQIALLVTNQTTQPTLSALSTKPMAVSNATCQPKNWQD
jgi:hypothetical protein